VILERLIYRSLKCSLVCLSFALSHFLQILHSLPTRISQLSINSCDTRYILLPIGVLQYYYNPAMPSLPPHKKNHILAAALLANGICKTMHEQNRASRALLLDFYLKERAKEKHHYRKSKAAKNRRRKQRKSWKQFQASLNDHLCI
jgi:hypothetical protein